MARTVAPSAPSAAASVGVATPAMIEPSTMTISVTGPAMSLSTSRTAAQPMVASTRLTGGADSGLSRARTST